MSSTLRHSVRELTLELIKLAVYVADYEDLAEEEQTPEQIINRLFAVDEIEFYYLGSSGLDYLTESDWEEVGNLIEKEIKERIEAKNIIEE